MRPDTEKVTTIIRETAEAEILPRFRRLSDADISEKGPGDLVTIADQLAEIELSKRLRDLLPGSVAIGEEGVAAHSESMNRLSESNPVWIIDPVDGTHNFAHGVPCFAVIVALAHKGHIEAGWIHDPIANKTLYAAQGEGAWQGGERVSIAQTGKPMDQMTGSFKRTLRHQFASRSASGEKGLPKIIKRYRCVGREYMDMAVSELDFVAYGGTLKPWDHAAGVLIHREAGGYDAMLENQTPYQVRAGLLRGEIMLAPSADVWNALKSLLDYRPGEFDLNSV